MTSATGPGSGDRPATGRRSNGLAAQHWAAVGDVDPRQAGDLLVVLGAAGIAAYVTPSTGSVGAYLSVQLPERPLDRLHVDAGRRLEAVALVRAELDEPPAATSDDQAFAEIIAGWDLPAAGNRLAVEDAGTQPGSAAAQDPSVVRPAQPARALGPRDHEPAEAIETGWNEEHYVPPPPPPLPRPPLAVGVCVAAIVAGIAVLLWTSIRGEASTLSLVLGVLGVAGGTAGLIARMRDADVDDGDDGAVV